MNPSRTIIIFIRLSITLAVILKNYGPLIFTPIFRFIAYKIMLSTANFYLKYAITIIKTHIKIIYIYVYITYINYGSYMLLV